MRYANISCNETQTIKTLNIDNLSEFGLKMIYFYSSSLICKASSLGLLFGDYSLKMYICYVFSQKDRLHRNL